MNIELSKIIEKKEEENNNLIKELNKTKKEKKLISNKYNKYFKEKEELQKFKILNSNVNFEIDPNVLEYGGNLASDRINSGLLYNIDAYVGLEDKKGYLVYQNLDYNLIVKRIYDKQIIKTLEGHKNKIRVIRYYQNKNNKIINEEYILSCDANKLIIIWDINNNFEQKYSLQEKFKDNINDVLILFNIFNKKYLITSSDNFGNNDEFLKLYELKENILFVKNIDETNKNKNNYLIPWLYKSKYYIISCCDYKISINNIFENEVYANLTKKQEGKYHCGFLYNDNYLCVSDINHNFISIWNLVDKTLDRTIYFNDKVGHQIVQWNNKYTIVSSDKCFAIIDLQNGKEYEKIEINNKIILGLKKIKDENLGESLICSEENNIISIYLVKNKLDKNESDEDEYSDNYDDEDNDVFDEGPKKKKNRNNILILIINFPSFFPNIFKFYLSKFIKGNIY